MSRPLRTSMSKESLQMIGIPKTLTDAMMDDFETYGNVNYETLKEYVLAYLNFLDSNFDDNIGLTFYGSNGVGKTMAVSMIIKEAYRRRYSAYRVTFSEYISTYTKAWNVRSADEREESETELYKYKAAEFLALEEVGKEIDSSVTAPILEDLLRYREDKGLPIFICTNLQTSVLREKYGESVYSLIRGNTLPIKIEGEDMREHYFKQRNGE